MLIANLNSVSVSELRPSSVSATVSVTLGHCEPLAISKTGALPLLADATMAKVYTPTARKGNVNSLFIDLPINLHSEVSDAISFGPLVIKMSYSVTLLSGAPTHVNVPADSAKLIPACEITKLVA